MSATVPNPADFAPIVILAIPGGVQLVHRAVLLAQPRAEFGQRVFAEAEVGVGNVARRGPVDDVRFAPQIPAGEGGVPRTPPAARRPSGQSPGYA